MCGSKLGEAQDRLHRPPCSSRSNFFLYLVAEAWVKFRGDNRELPPYTRACSLEAFCDFVEAYALDIGIEYSDGHATRRKLVLISKTCLEFKLLGLSKLPHANVEGIFCGKWRRI